MSKKKTKTRIEKSLTTHHLEHIAKNTVAAKTGVTGVSQAGATLQSAKSPLDELITKDLKNTIILIGVFVLVIVALGIVVYTTGVFNPILSHWNIKY
jgi:hypothetical protein